MARWLGIDYGYKKTGIAATDSLKIIASALETIPTHTLYDFLADYIAKEDVELIVVGEPLHPDGNPLGPHSEIIGLTRKLRKLYPEIKVVLQDERFTSKEARRIIEKGGFSKKKQDDRRTVDKISAALILQYYMEAQGI